MTAARGRFFEDLPVGEVIRHATPRTLTTGDAALYQALYGNRFAVQSSDALAAALGLPRAPLDDLLVFHTVFGKTVPDISLNAVANLGYADGRFLAPVYPGDTLRAESVVIGRRDTSGGEAGVVYVRSTGYRQDGTAVLDYVRWVLVRKRVPGTPVAEAVVPELPKAVPAAALGASVPRLDLAAWDDALAGVDRRFADYAVGDRIDHVDGATVEEAEHQMATRLYQNTARVHFDAFAARDTRFGRRLVYGGHVISIARALSFNGLAGCCHVAAINAGRHVAPIFAGDTVYAWSEIIDKSELDGRSDLGALRVRTIATRDRPCGDFPGEGPAVVLDLDLWLLAVR